MSQRRSAGTVIRGLLLTLLISLLAVEVQAVGGFGGEDSATVESHDVLFNTQAIKLYENKTSTLWKYHPGDSAGWSEPGYADELWRDVDPSLPLAHIKDYDWQGIGWFRYHLTLDPAQYGRVACLFIGQAGSSEIYLNGRPLVRFGTIGKDARSSVLHLALSPSRFYFVLPSQADNTLAVRFANYNPERNRFWSDFCGFQIALSLMGKGTDEFFAETLIDARAQSFVTGFCLAIALLHLFLFLAYPRLAGNLYYALFTLSCAGLAFFPAALRFTHVPAEHFLYGYMFKLSLIGAGVFCPLVLYASFYRKLPRIFWALAGTGVILAIVGTRVPRSIIGIFLYVGLFESLRVAALAVYRRKDGARLIGSGYLLFVVGGGFQMLEEFEIFKNIAPHDFPYYLIGIFGLLIATSVYLARTFATMSRTLIKQLDQVNELSARALEQERAAHEQEMKQKLLETELSHNRTELERAAQLEKAHRELSIANQHLKDTQSQLVQSEKMASLGTLVAGIAHEINTPVGAVHSMHNTLIRAIDKLKAITASKKGLSDDDTARLQSLFGTIDEANKVIESGTDRVATIVKRLRSFVRLDEAELKKADINEGLEDTLMMIAHQIKDRITVNRHYGRIGEINCYPGRLNQVFLNLLNNAQQAIDGKGTIDVTTKIAGPNVVITITDTGSGIRPEYLNKIFDPGFTTKGVGVGTGLGLSICYKIIQEHRGRITVESEVGKGTTFTVTIPKNLDSSTDSA